LSEQPNPRLPKDDWLTFPSAEVGSDAVTPATPGTLEAENAALRKKVRESGRTFSAPRQGRLSAA